VNSAIHIGATAEAVAELKRATLAVLSVKPAYEGRIGAIVDAWLKSRVCHYLASSTQTKAERCTISGCYFTTNEVKKRKRK